MVAQMIPEMAAALYFGHPGNQGDAVLWGQALGAATRHLSGHQGHGSVAHPAGILISWATITAGGIQVNETGARFSDEMQGYSEQAAHVLRQPGGVVWSIFDQRIAGIARQFEDFRVAEQAGAVLGADTIAELEVATRLPAGTLRATLDETARLAHGDGQDRFGRDFTIVPPLAPPYRAVRVTGALFHTQGGLAVDTGARVRDQQGAALPNLFAAGGAAAGVSGDAASGYLSGNGLLVAVSLGFIAGRSAAGG
jgi:fumarate reductase flavoprotein subunit